MSVAHDIERDLWIVNGHQEVMAVLLDWRHFSASTLGDDSFPLASPDGALLADERTLLASDPPLHTRLRRLLVLPSDEETEAAMQPALQAALACAAPAGHCEVIAEVCQPVMAATLAALLGCRIEDVAAWIRVCSGCNAQSRPGWLRAAHEQMVTELWRAGFSHAPPADGLLLRLRRAAERGEIEPLQAVDLCITLMKGAADTVSHAVGNSLCALAQDAGMSDALRKRPEQLEAFVDESLRCYSPVQMTMRRVTEPIELGGVALPTGARVLVLLGAANQDRATFDSPERLRLGRNEARSLAFGAGPHRCPGAQLARLMATAILRALLGRGALRVDLTSSMPVEVAALLGYRRLEVRFE